MTATGQPRRPPGAASGGEYDFKPQTEADQSLLDAEAASSLTFVVYGLCLTDNPEIRYIGKTSKTANERLYFHKRSASRSEVKFPVHKWMRSHGVDNVIAVVLASVESGDDDGLNELEIRLIAEHRQHGARLLNLTDGGEGTRGIKVPDSKRELMSRRMSGEGNPMYGVHRFGEEAPMYGRRGPDSPRFGRTGPMLGKTHSAEARAKMSARNTGEGNPMYGRTGERAPGYGRTGPQNPMYGKPSPMRGVTGPAHPNYGKPKSPEVLYNMREGMHRAHHVKKDRPNATCEFCLADPDTVAVLGAAAAEKAAAKAAQPNPWTGRKHTPESREKMRASARARFAREGRDAPDDTHNA